MSLLGTEGGLYYNTKWHPTADYYSNPYWQEVTQAISPRDVGMREERDITPYVDRDQIPGAPGNYKAVTTILPDTSLEFDLLNIKGDIQAQAFLDRLLDSYQNGQSFEMLMLDQKITITGAEGKRLAVIVRRMERREPIGGIQTYSISLRPSFYPTGENPTWFIVP